ncbi:hypothetical protein CERZMDRAFT_117975 [Cercospora zeae-maydis SCOH1-5]|uniref:tyrosinase n=1 Tax=Cercospora zeae-maydis SCOH1-5 TaxID=717836 RepID=A0A6A6FD74_9PEZI|nr:hypothetical protein CERZMDRAFT_117975 [Cercospora zeae-maydis SCOH1-5]
MGTGGQGRYEAMPCGPAPACVKYETGARMSLFTARTHAAQPWRHGLVHSGCGRESGTASHQANLGRLLYAFLTISAAAVQSPALQRRHVQRAQLLHFLGAAAETTRFRTALVGHLLATGALLLIDLIDCDDGGGHAPQHGSSQSPVSCRCCLLLLLLLLLLLPLAYLSLSLSLSLSLRLHLRILTSTHPPIHTYTCTAPPGPSTLARTIDGVAPSFTTTTTTTYLLALFFFIIIIIIIITTAATFSPSCLFPPTPLPCRLRTLECAFLSFLPSCPSGNELLSSPHNTNTNKNNIRALAGPLQKRDGEVIVTGARGLGDGRVHARLEINDFSKNRPDMWSLYIRALAKWKEGTKDDPTSYWSIAKIHGVPRQDWDGVQKCADCQGADGYCTHDSVHFPAWHRPYMALFEQELMRVAFDIASSFSGAFGDRLKAAAQKLRAPYWDWAAVPDPGTPVLPTVMTAQQVTIEGPNGQETVDNPLYSYHFNDSSDMAYAVFTTWPDTFRWPNSNNVDAHSQQDQCIDAFTNSNGNLRDQIYQLLTQCKSYLGFATDASGDQRCANSLEGIHNTVHLNAGGPGYNGISGGHMAFLPLASYDPLFFLHHANVDRLVTLYQTANPDLWGATQVAQHSTWTIAQGTTQDANSPLMPFRKAANEYWTTNDVRDFAATFDYTYPEYIVGDGSRKTVMNYLNELYGPNPSLTASSLSVRAEVESGNNPDGSNGGRAIQAPWPQGYASSSSTSGSASAAAQTAGSGSGMGFGLGPLSISIGLPWHKPTGTASPPYPTVSGVWNGTRTSLGPLPTGTGAGLNPAFIAPNGSVYQYQCNIETPRYALNNSYVVYVFDGQPSTNDTSEWASEKNCIGHIGVLAGGDMSHAGVTSAGSVPITRYLQQLYLAGKISALSEDVVIPYMKEHLEWIIVYDGARVSPDTLQGYKASFLSGLLSPTSDGELPTWSNLLPQVDVTKGKAGGITEAVEGILGGVGNALSDALGDVGGNLGGSIGGIMGGLLPGGNAPHGYGPAPPAPSSPADTQDSPVPATTAPPAQGPPSYASPPEQDVTTTVYTTQYVTYCPCTESTAAPQQTSAPAYAKQS